MLSDIIFSLLAIGLGISIFALGLIYLISYIGGWGALAREYAANSEINKGAPLEEKRQRKAWVGLVSLGGMVTARCFENGVELSAVFPFSPPLFFRWDEIGECRLVNAIPFPQAQQFTVGGRTIRLSNPLNELERRKTQKR